MSHIQLGIDVLKTSDFEALAGRRVALMTNLSAVNQHLLSTYQLFIEALEAHKIDLCAFFAPEHGFAGTIPDGVDINTVIDRRANIPIYSLYGSHFRPQPEMLKNIDVIVCDIQDIGVRYYTFLWTITYVLEAAGEHNVEVMLLDRPNPLGGEKISGGSLEPHLSTLVGRYPIPICHGMTLGEISWMINDIWNPTPAKLTIVPCEGWRRTMNWNQTGMSWVSPSPNMPHFSTAVQYPGACLIEGTNLSEGRGTPLPFEIVGAPWMNGEALAEALNAQNFTGVRFRPHSFKPMASKWVGHDCGGVQGHITDLTLWKPIETWLGVINQIKVLYPESFAWLPPQNAQGIYHFDRLIGSTAVREGMDKGVPIETLIAGWDTFCQNFNELRQPYLLYI